MTGYETFAPKTATAAAIVVAVAAAPAIPDDFASDVIAVLFAVCGGMATQIGLIARAKVNWPLIASELMFSAIGGFVVHAVMISNVEEPRIIWSAAAIAGAAGSKALRQYGHKYLKRWDWFADDLDKDKDA